MINEELKTFINKMRAAGKTDPEIAAELKTAGWAEADIAPVLVSMTPSSAGQSPPQSVPETQIEVKSVRNKRPIWIILFLIVILLVGGYLLLRILPLVLANTLRRQGTVIKERVVAPTSAPPVLQSTTQPQSITGSGSDFSSAIIVPADSEATGVAWEYDWLKKNACSDNNGYKKPAGQVLKSNNNHRYDVITAVCNDGKNIDYYFLIDNFFGKL